MRTFVNSILATRELIAGLGNDLTKGIRGRPKCTNDLNEEIDCDFLRLGDFAGERGV